MTLRYTDSSQMWWARVSLANSLKGSEVPARDAYKMLDAYYLNNGLYDAVQLGLYEAGIWTEGMKPLRNPAHRVVEFYVAKLWPGSLPDALPILSDNPAVVERVEQVWRWSNWGAQKQVFARWFANLGDGFLKVATRRSDAGQVDQVYLQNIKAENITDFDADERGFLTWVRIDVPQVRRDERGKLKSYWYTEVWSKAEQARRIWESDKEKGPKAELSQLGRPVDERAITELTGSDFIPVVHAKFQDIGEKRGVNAYMHALDKIDEANRQATRLHQMLFRYGKPIIGVFANATDPQGRPLPAPHLGAGGAKDAEEEDDQIRYFPGHSSMEFLVPNLNYEAALKILQDHMNELEQDLPEMTYSRLKELGLDLSGRAVRLLMSDAIDRATEARGNAETALIRANQMALTIGQNAGVWPEAGSYEAGDFEHTFAKRDVIALSDLEKLETVQAGVNAGAPLETMLRRVGWTEEDLEQMAKDRQAADQREKAKLAEMMLRAQRDFDRGDNPEE